MDEPQRLFGAHSRDRTALIGRIKYILSYYSDWMLNKDKDKEDMYAIIDTAFGTKTGYNLESFLADYHFVVDDENRKLITTEIHKMDDEVKDKEKDTVCDAEICNVIDRSEIDRSMARRAYYRNSKLSESDVNKNVAVQQMLDSLHMFMYHTFRVHPDEFDHIQEAARNEDEIESDEDEDEIDDVHNYEDKVSQKIVALIDKAKSASSRFRRSRNTATIHNKFMTLQYNEDDRAVAPPSKPVAKQEKRASTIEEDIAVYQSAVYGNEQLLLQQKPKVSTDPCVTDKLFAKLNDRAVKKKTLHELESFLVDEEYDTDAVTDDLEFQQEDQSQLKHIISDGFETAALFLHRTKFEEYTKRNKYEPGLRFFYHDYFKDNEDERSLIYQAGSSYVYDWNRGYKLKEWYIAPKYANLKEELTQNQTAPFPIDAYEGTLETATMKLEAYRKTPNARNLVCSWTEWKKCYNISKGERITLKHIMALLCYTDYTVFCFEFSKSFRKIYPTESDESLKERHREFRHWARYLRECVEVFGIEQGCDESKIQWFYHGVSRSMLLDSTDIKLFGPVSTTSVYEVAVARFAENGIVLQIRKNPNCYMPYFPCSYWSAFSDEYEYLYLGGLKFFSITTIRDIPNKQRYDGLIRVLTEFHYMVDGYRLRDLRVRNRDVKVCRQLVAEENKNTLLKSLDSSVPLYFLNLFHHFLGHLTYVDVNFGYMDKHLCMEARGYKYWGFKKLIPIFCVDNNADALNFALLCSLMRNVKTYTLWRFHRSGCEASIEVNQVFRSSILEATTIDSAVEKFIVCQPKLEEEQTLESYIDEHQKAFIKCGWQLQRDPKFKHPRRGTYPLQEALVIQKL